MGQYHHPVCIEAEEGLDPAGMDSGLKEGEQGFNRPSTSAAIIALVCARGVTIGLIGILIRNDGRSVSAGATIILSAGLVHVAGFFFPFARLNGFRMPRKSRQEQGNDRLVVQINLSIALGPLIAAPAGQVSD
jgi:hypothetical protein